MTAARVYRIHNGHLTLVTNTHYQPTELVDPPNYEPLRIAAAAAALAAGAARIHAPQEQWTGMSDGCATTVLPDGTRLLYIPNPTGRGSCLVAQRLCRHGAWHTRALPDRDGLAPFADAVAVCNIHVEAPVRVPARKDAA